MPGGFLVAGSLLSGVGGIASLLATSGAGLVLSGVGTLLSQKATGIATTSRNPISPWQVIYGERKVGGTVVYQEEVASSNRILLLVIAVACHPCDAITQIFLNNKAVPIKLDPQFADESNPNGFWVSYNTTQQWQIETISRTNDVVSVTFTQSATAYLSGFDGQTFQIQNTRDSAGGNSFDGYFPVVATGPNSFTFTCGGPQGAGTGNPGHVTSTWPQYGGTMTAGFYLGNQTQASGIIIGNTVGGDGSGNGGYWTSAHVLQGRTYVAMKLVYDSTIYNGLPEISFVVHGKNNIYDPRTGVVGYSKNAALCIADYLAQPTWGYNAFKLDGTQPQPNWTPATWNANVIPTDDLTAAANICDEQVTLALGGAENRYECNGSFDVSVTRGEVLQNLLTSCGGRLIEIGGQFFIQPAAWVSPSGAITIGGCSSAPKMMMSSVGLVPTFYNSPASSYPPSCGGTTESQFVFALGLLAAFQATGNSNATALANMVLAAIEPYLFRNQPVPAQVTAQNIWSPNSYFDVKQAFPATDGETISVTQGFATDLNGGWRPLVGPEIQTSCDAYNWLIRLFGLAAEIIDGAHLQGEPDLGYGLSPYGSSYGDPAQNPNLVTSQYVTMMSAIQQMARIAYNVSFTEISGNTETIITPTYQGGMIPMIVEFLGSPAPSLSSWFGPAYIGYQSPWAVNQVNTAWTALAVEFLAAAQATLASLGTVAASVTFTVTGANPQTLTVPIQINSVGQASAQFLYGGTNVGTDTIVATLPAQSLTSNAAEVAWSAYPAGTSVFGVTVDVMAADGSGLFNGLTPVLSTTSVMGLMFNSHPSSIFPGDPHDSGNQANPFVNNAVATDGSYAGDIAIPNTSGQFNAVIKFSMSVAASGNVSFSAYVNSAFVIGFNGGVTFVSGTQNLGALHAGTAELGLPALAGLNNGGDWPGGNWAVVDFVLNFPKPGIYQGEADFASGLFGEREFCVMLQGLGSVVEVIPNIGVITGGGSTTATGTAPSGDLQLTPFSGGYALGQQAIFNLAMSGLTYTGPTAGPFAPVYQYAVPAGQQTWLPTNTFGWAGPDPRYTGGVYQYRPLAELCDLIAQAAGTETWYSQAVSVKNSFITWLYGQWTSAMTGPPNYFPQTGPQTTGIDIYSAALILYSVLSLDLGARPTGAGGESAMDSKGLALLNLVYSLFEGTYLTSGPMAGTFCLDPSGAQDWSLPTAGQLLRSLSMLVQWAGLNSQSAIRAQAIVWIDGIINFSLNAVTVVDPDLGYTVDDLRGGIQWRPKLARTDLYNGIKGTYVCAANQWQQSDVPSYAQDTIHGYTNGSAAHDNDLNWDEDGERRWRDVQLPFTTSCPMAQRLMKIELMRIRQQGRGMFQGMMTCYQNAPLDTIYLSFAPFSWVNKVLEVVTPRLLMEKSTTEGGQEVTLLGTELDIQETASSVYDWNADEELSVQGYSYLPGLANVAPD